MNSHILGQVGHEAKGIAEARDHPPDPSPPMQPEGCDIFQESSVTEHSRHSKESLDTGLLALASSRGSHTKEKQDACGIPKPLEPDGETSVFRVMAPSEASLNLLENASSPMRLEYTGLA